MTYDRPGDRWKVATPLFTGKPKKESPAAAKTVAELKQDVAEIRWRLEALRLDTADKKLLNDAVRQCNNLLDALNKLKEV